MKLFLKEIVAILIYNILYMDYESFRKKVLDENQEEINKVKQKDSRWFYIKEIW